MLERFNHWYESGINPTRGWPGHALQLGYWLVASGMGAPIINSINSEISLSQMDDKSILAISVAEVTCLYALVSAGGFITRRFIDRVLPESYAQMPSLGTLIKPQVRKLFRREN